MNIIDPRSRAVVANWQIGLVKIAAIALGVIVGATWPDVFAPYRWLLWIVFAVAAVWAVAAMVKNPAK